MNPQFINGVLESKTLPSLPTVVIRLIELLKRADATSQQIADLLYQDPALATKALRLINSSGMGLSQKVTNLTHAISLLGQQKIKTLATSFGLIGNFRQATPEGLDTVVYWRHSLFSAVAAKAIARKLKMEEDEEAFLIGLLQNVGQLAAACALGKRYTSVVTQVTCHRELAAMEQLQFEATHAEVGGALGEQWELPDTLAVPIRFHEQPDQAPENLRTLTYTAALGSQMADIVISEQQGHESDTFFNLTSQFSDDAARWLNLSWRATDELLNSVGDATRELADLFEIDSGPDLDFRMLSDEFHQAMEIADQAVKIRN